MRNLAGIFLCLFLAAVAFGGSGPGEDERASLQSSSPDHIAALVEALQSEEVAERDAARQRVVDERRRLIQALIEIASGNNRGKGTRGQRGRGISSKQAAIYLLGDLRAEEAIKVLFDNLTYESEVRPRGFMRIDMLGRLYPAVGSLARIGKPAAVKALDMLRVTDDPLRRELCAWIVMAVEGRELGELLIQRKLEYRLHPVTRKNLEEALKYFEKKKQPVPDQPIEDQAE